MSDALKRFCLLERELQNLKNRKRETTSDFAANRKSARKVLLESMRSSGQTALTANIGGEIWCLKLKQVDPPAVADAEVADRAEALWKEDGVHVLRETLLDAPNLVSGAVDFIVERSVVFARSSEPRPQPKETLVVRRAPAKMREDLPSAGQNLESLAGTLVESGQRLAALSKEHTEAKRSIAEARKQAEEALIADIEEAGGGVQCVNLRDPSGLSENYYLRVKMARKAPARKFTVPAYRKVLTQMIELEIKSLNLTGSKAVEHLCDPETGARICEGVRKVVTQRTGGPVRESRRISLDKVRSTAATRPGASTSQ